MLCQANDVIGHILLRVHTANTGSSPVLTTHVSWWLHVFGLYGGGSDCSPLYFNLNLIHYVVQPFIFNFLFLRCDSLSVVQSVA